MDFSEALNSPLAVVVILAIVFGFLALGLDKLTYFVRSINKQTPTDTIAKSYEHLEPVLKNMNENLTLLNENLKSQKEISEKNHSIVEKTLDRIESKMK